MNSLDMLKTEEGQNNAVFACFGSAAQHSQLFEVALGSFLVTYNRLGNTALTVADLDALETRVSKQTMGTLLAQVRQHVTISDVDINRLMDESLRARNFLMHHFFRRRCEEFRTEQCRMGMIAELLTIETVLARATSLTNGMRVALESALDGTGPADSRSPTVFTMEVNLPGREDAAQPDVAADDRVGRSAPSRVRS